MSIFWTLIYCWLILSPYQQILDWLWHVWQKKLTVLLLILSEQRKPLLAIDIDNVKIYEDRLIILPISSLKHTKPSRPPQAIVYHKFNGNPKFCVVGCAKLYIEIRKELVPPEIKQFLVTYGEPHKAASDDTISRWIKNTISSVGIDIDVFKTQPTRSASSSKAKTSWYSICGNSEERFQEGC